MRPIFTRLAKGETAMLKSAIIASSVLFAASAPAIHPTEIEPATAQATILNLPDADTVVAQISYLEISHGIDGFGLSITDKTAIFVDFEFPGNLHIRIGF